MKKRLLSTLLVLCMVLALLPMEVLAETTNTDTAIIDYPVLGGNIQFDTTTGAVISCDKSVTEAVIPKTINGIAVTSINSSAFAECRVLKNVDIQCNISQIKAATFLYCFALQSITLPDSVTFIQDYAFCDCSALRSVNIPNGVTGIGYRAFGGCGTLPYIVIPDSVKTIATGAFIKCRDLEYVYYYGTEAQWKNIGIGSDNTDLRSANIRFNYNLLTYSSKCGDDLFWVLTGSSLVISGTGKMYDYSKSDPLSKSPPWGNNKQLIESVTIDEGVISIGHSAFSGCENIKNISINTTVTSIETGAFYRCTNLTDVYYAGTEEQWNAITIGSNNESLINATIHYNSAGPDQPSGPDIPGGEITFQIDSTTINVGDSMVIAASIPHDGNLHQNDISWSSSNENILTVSTPNTIIGQSSASSTVMIQGVARGTATVTVATSNGATNSIEITVGPRPNEIQISGNKSVLVGNTETLDAKIKLNVLDVTDSIEWTSSNSAILAFDSNGNSTVSHPIGGITIPTDSVITDSVTIYGRSPGKVKVTCKLSRSGVEASFDVLVYSEESLALQDRTNDWMTAFYNYINAVVNLLGENKTEVLEATKEEQARALMAADQASSDRLVTFLYRTDERDEKIALPVYMAVVDMLAEETGNEFDLGKVDVSGADKDGYFTTVSMKIVKKVQDMINTKPYEYQYDNVFISLAGITVEKGARSRDISYAVNNPNNSRLVAHLGSRQDELQATVEAYLKELAKLEKNAINEVYAQMVKSVLNKSLSELIKTGVKEKITDALGKHIDKFTQTGAGNVVTAISTGIDYYKYVDKIVKLADHDPAELLLDLSSMESLKFESTSIKDKTVKAAMKSLEAAKEALEKAIKEYADTGKIDWGAAAVGWAKDTFSGIKSTFKCPVNIAVYDRAGEQVGYVGDDDLWYDDDVIYIEKYGDAKIIYSNNAALRFEVVGSNYGMLNCTFEEYSNGVTVGRINYYDIPLYNGSNISAEVADKAITNQNVIVTAEGTGVITADEIIISAEYKDTTVNIAVNVEQGGTVIGNGEYVRGDAVNLQAVVENGYAFQGWKNDEGALLSISQVYEFTAKEDVTLTASFAEYIDEDELSFYLVTFNAVGGSVNPTYLATEYNGKLENLPIPTRDGYTFEGWYTKLEGGTQITTNTTFTEDTTVYAHWTEGETPSKPKPTHTVTVSTSPTEGGSVTGSGTYNEDQSVTVKAIPANGYRFLRWTENGTTVSTSATYTFTVTGSRTLTAVFEQTSSSGGDNTPNYSSSGDSDPTYSITVPSRVTGGTVKVTPTSASKGQRVTITAKPNSGYELNTLRVTDSKGSILTLTDRGDDKYTFTMPGSRVSIDVSFKATALTAPTASVTTSKFTDVPANAYYADAVAWAVSNGITYGVTDTTFGPDVTCTRAQIVSFLWRQAGSPKMSGTNTFTDVSTTDYYYDAVLWAVTNGITAGTTDTTFSPDATCTRAQAMTFLYRDKKSPAVSGSSDFTDVPTGEYYADAVQWAVANGVTYGLTDTTFGPNQNCTRAQIVSFMYRARTN